MRLFNPTGERVDATLTVGFDVSAVEQTNFREEHTGDLAITDGRVPLTFGPYEIKTVRLETA